jgi:HdeA/HdeB family
MQNLLSNFHFVVQKPSLWRRRTKNQNHNLEDNMKTLIASAAALFLLAAAPAQAETIDVSTLKCSELVAMNAEEGSYVMVWLHGYFGGEANDTTIDLDAFEMMGTAIGEQCGSNPELGVMTVVKQINAE